MFPVCARSFRSTVSNFSVPCTTRSSSSSATNRLRQYSNDVKINKIRPESVTADQLMDFLEKLLPPKVVPKKSKTKLEQVSPPAINISSHLVRLPSCFFCGAVEGVYLNSKQPHGYAYSCNKCHHRDTLENVKFRYKHYLDMKWQNVLNASSHADLHLEPIQSNLSSFVPPSTELYFDEDNVILNRSLLAYKVTQKINSQGAVVLQFLRTFDSGNRSQVDDNNDLLHFVGTVVDCNEDVDGEICQMDIPNNDAPISLFGWHLVSHPSRVPPKIAIVTDDAVDALALHSTLWQWNKWEEAVVLAADKRDLTENNATCLLPYLAQFDEVILWTRADSLPGTIVLTNAMKKAYNLTPLVHEDLGVDMADGVYSVFRRCGKNEDRKALLELMLDRKDGGRDLAYVMQHERMRDDFMNVKYLLQYEAFEKGLCNWNRFDVLNEYLIGFRPGELTVMTGPTGCGKTTWLGEYLIDLITNGKIRSMLYSFEMDPAKMYYKLCCQYARRSLKTNENLARRIHAEFIDSKLLTCVGPVEIRKLRNVETLRTRILCDIRQKGLQHIILDNLQYLAGHMPKERGGNQLSLQEDLVCCLRDIVNSEEVHITMVSHPRKTEGKLNMTAIYGGTRTTQEADNVFIMQRGEDNSRRLEIVKNRAGGRCTHDKEYLSILFDESSFCHKLIVENQYN